jgi:hypothetical protein
MIGKPVPKPVGRQWLKSVETCKPVGITGKSVPKPINHFFKKNHFLKKIDSPVGLSKTGETGLSSFRPVFQSMVTCRTPNSS